MRASLVRHPERSEGSPAIWWRSLAALGMTCAQLGMMCILGIAYSTSISHLPFSINTQNTQALQRGARFYMNYCSGCHSLQYMRYNQLAKGLGLLRFDGAVDEPLLLNNLVFTQSTLQAPIRVSMPAKDARQWFGVMPPDLSLVARSRGPRWIYAYLQGFYDDPKRPFHSNNLIFPDVGMPDVLAPLKGRMLLQKGEVAGLVRVEPGSMTAAEFEQSLQDLITFLVYVGEPTRDLRRMIGVGVIAFLSVLFVLLFLLNRMYWRRVH
ncbi:MAG: cytochrome c1 [Gammaproteobacteria bacterium]|nr:cytochrome c1 [Gammaproteobacteria bacterium]